MDSPLEEGLPSTGSEENRDPEVETANELRVNALDWTVVERAAKSAFDIWVGQPELSWAKKAFNVLSRKGLLGDADVFQEHVRRAHWLRWC
jgi:hypothetical protein